MTAKEEFDNALHLLFWYLDKDEIYQEKLKPVLTFFSPQILTAIATLTVGGLTAKYWLIPFWQRRKRNAGYKKQMKLARERREDEMDFVRKQCQELEKDARIQEIIEMIKQGPMAIHKKLQDGSITPTQVVTAYQHYMIIAQDKTNCLTTILTDALEQAQDLERRYLGKPKPKLYGVIFSLKDMYNLKGKYSTIGMGKDLDQPKDEDSVLARVLKEHGAIIVAKTGYPQTLFSFSSGNPIYGTVTNPNSLSRSAGGSSSGEGALLAMNGSMAGAGSDIAGSVRVPAHFCGICSLRPMIGRFSATGVKTAVRGAKGVVGTMGLMGRDVEMLAECHSIILGPEMFEMDPQVPPIPWRPEIYNNQEPLRIGYYTDNGYFEPTPGVKRAVELAVSGLRNIGHTLIPFEIPDPWTLANLFTKMVCQDKAEQLLQLLEDEDIDPCIAQSLVIPATVHRNVFVRTAIMAAVRWKTKRTYNFMKGLLELRQPVDLMKTFAARDAYRESFIKKWQDMGLDALVCPVFASPAVPPDVAGISNAAASYSFFFNALDFPAGVVPVTVENEVDQCALEKYPEDDFLYVAIKQGVRGALGMPIGVQCVSLPYQEEMALRVMRDVQNTSGKDMFMKLPLLSQT